MKTALAGGKDFSPISATTGLTTAQQSRLNRIKDFTKQAPDIPWVAPGSWGDLMYVDPNSVTEPIEGMFPVATLDQPALKWAYDFDQDIADIDFMAGVDSRPLGESVREIEGHGGTVEDWAIRYRFKTQEALQTIRARRLQRENEIRRRTSFAAGKPLPDNAKIVNYHEHFQEQAAQNHLKKLEEAREGSLKHDSSSSENASSDDKSSEPGSEKSGKGSSKNGSDNKSVNPASGSWWRWP
ncbi:hypothetical protein BDV97DRAFT_354111 [Delphinella strobiligena]|nr:hypothetical protein BDV97DRAFT_354111 [Delphinella strobiligena]